MSKKNTNVLNIQKGSIGSPKLKRMPTNIKRSVGPPRSEKIPKKPKPQKK